MNNSDLIERSTAHHESGHILMHLLTGIEITGANIIKNSGNLGVVRSGNYGLIADFNKEMRDNQIKCFLAGGIAEEYYCKRKCIKYEPEYSGADYDCITQIFYEGGHRFRNFENYEKHVDNLKKETEKQLRIHWSFIEVVAGVLLSKKHLTTNEISELWSHYRQY